MALGPNCDLNIILLEQLQENGITYHNDLMLMTLIRNGKVITRAKKEWNLLRLDLATFNQAILAKVIAIKGKSRPTHLVSKNKQI